MKKNIIKFAAYMLTALPLGGVGGGLLSSCNDFIDVEPQGVISEELAMSQPNEMVTAAYAKLGDDWYT